MKRSYRNILAGMGSVINIFPAPAPIPDYRRTLKVRTKPRAYKDVIVQEDGFAQDARNIYSDWVNVGNGIARAMGTVLADISDGKEDKN